METGRQAKENEHTRSAFTEFPSAYDRVLAECDPEDLDTLRLTRRGSEDAGPAYDCRGEICVSVDRINKYW